MYVQRLVSCHILHTCSLSLYHNYCATEVAEVQRSCPQQWSHVISRGLLRIQGLTHKRLLCCLLPFLLFLQLLSWSVARHCAAVNYAVRFEHCFLVLPDRCADCRKFIVQGHPAWHPGMCKRGLNNLQLVLYGHLDLSTVGVGLRFSPSVSTSVYLCVITFLTLLTFGTVYLTMLSCLTQLTRLNPGLINFGNIKMLFMIIKPKFMELEVRVVIRY